MSVTMQFATMLRNSRCKAQITQREAAELCGISLRHYQNLEMGFTNPKLSNAIYIANAMHLNLNELQSEASLNAISI